MKKLLVLGAFIMMGSMVFAQTPTKAKATQAPAATMQAATPVAVEVANPEEAAVKKETKKECSDAEKKQCGTKAANGKKSCCSSKAAATKEETQ